MSSTNKRRFLHITLIHTELRSEVTFDVIINRLLTLAWDVKAVIIGTEHHNDEGTHYHIGVLNNSASKHNFTKKCRAAFPEFEGRAFNIKAHKAWSTVVSYAAKEDGNPFLWGDITMEEVKMHTDHRKARDSGKGVSKNLLLSQEIMWNAANHHELARDPYLFGRMMVNYSSVVKLYETVQFLKAKDQKVLAMDYIKSLENYSQGAISYTESEIGGSRMEVLDWFAKNLYEKREVKQKQLLLWGLPDSMKTTHVMLLEEAGVKIYAAPPKAQDYRYSEWLAGDLWLFDEFSAKDHKLGDLFKLLAGQKIILRGSYEEPATKTHNPPMVMTCLQKPRFSNSWDEKAFYTRVKVIQLEPNKSLRLDPKRYVKTILEIKQAFKEGFEDVLLSE